MSRLCSVHHYCIIARHHSSSLYSLFLIFVAARVCDDVCCVQNIFGSRHSGSVIRAGSLDARSREPSVAPMHVFISQKQRSFASPQSKRGIMRVICGVRVSKNTRLQHTNKKSSSRDITITTPTIPKRDNNRDDDTSINDQHLQPQDIIIREKQRRSTIASSPSKKGTSPFVERRTARKKITAIHQNKYSSAG
jgi:hypothetical protein